MESVMVFKKRYEIQQIGGVEGAVFKGHQFFQILRLVLHAKLMRRIVHQLQQFLAFIDDGGAVAPRKNAGKKGRNLYILSLGKQVRNADRIIFYEQRLVVLRNFLVKKIF